MDPIELGLPSRIPRLLACLFRGSTPTAADWWQNINLGTQGICHGDDDDDCCSVRQGYHDAYLQPNYREEMEEAIHNCACPTCDVVLTGHSQGGAIAAVAAVVLADLDPCQVSS